MKYANWFKEHHSSKKVICASLQGEIKTDYLVVGGGFAGLHAALRLIEAGKKVVLIEKSTIGEGASGRSGGFITAESEIDLGKLDGLVKTKKDKAILSKIPFLGGEMIKEKIKKYKLKCDYRLQNSLYYSTKPLDHKILEEFENRQEKNLPVKIHDKKSLDKIHPGKNYQVALETSGPFGIDAYSYLNELKKVLLKKGCKIFEETSFEELTGSKIVTEKGGVKFKKAILCLDKFPNSLRKSDNCHYVSANFVVSEKLNETQINKIFPKKDYMCWDMKIVYDHYRLIYGNRLLLGGGTILSALNRNESKNSKPIKKVIKRFKENFPDLENVEFTHFWSGRISSTGDLLPIVDNFKKNENVVYCLGNVGIPWAVYCGNYLAEQMLGERSFDELGFLRNDRKFTIMARIEKIAGKFVTLLHP